MSRDNTEARTLEVAQQAGKKGTCRLTCKDGKHVYNNVTRKWCEDEGVRRDCKIEFQED